MYVYIYITEKGEVNCTKIEKYDNYVILDKVIDGSDIFINGKTVDDFNILDKHYVHTLNVSATQQFHRIIMKQKNEINDLKHETQTMEHMPKKKSAYIKKRYEQNKEEILKYRRERYRTIHKEDLNIKVSTGNFTLYFD